MKHIKLFELFTRDNHPNINEYQDKIIGDINGILIDLKDNNINYDLEVSDKRPNFMSISLTLKDGDTHDSKLSSLLFKEENSEYIDNYIVNSILVLNDYLIINGFKMKISALGFHYYDSPYDSKVPDYIPIHRFGSISKYEYKYIKFDITINKKPS
jgi:hypothetical protein